MEEGKNIKDVTHMDLPIDWENIFDSQSCNSWSSC